MKLMKNVLVLALAAATILLAACDNGSGGGNGGSGGGYVPPTLPQAQGDDPFAGLETLTRNGSSSTQYKVDTTKKTLAVQYMNSQTNQWITIGVYSYSYDGAATPPTVTLRYDSSIVSEEDPQLVTTQDLLANFDATMKKAFLPQLEEMFDSVSSQLGSLNGTQQNDVIKGLSTQSGTTFTVEDFSPDKKAATVEKLWQSPLIQSEVKEARQTVEKQASRTPTYAVTLTNRSGTTAQAAFQGQYDTNYPWYDQPAGDFYGDAGGGSATVNVTAGEARISNAGTSYTSTTFTGTSMECKLEDGTTKSFPYTVSGSGSSTVVTVTVDGTQVACTWNPSSSI